MPASSEKSHRGVLVRALLDADGKVRICLDDAVDHSGTAETWDKDTQITSRNYDIKSFSGLDFDQKELARFGYLILCRLWTFKENDEL